MRRGVPPRPSKTAVLPLLAAILAATPQAGAQESAVILDTRLLETLPEAGEASFATRPLAAAPEEMPRSRMVLPPEAAGLAASLSSGQPAAPLLRRAVPLGSGPLERAPLAAADAEQAASPPPSRAEPREPVPERLLDSPPPTAVPAGPPPLPLPAPKLPLPETPIVPPAVQPEPQAPRAATPPPEPETAPQPPPAPAEAIPPPGRAPPGPSAVFTVSFPPGETELSAAQKAEIAAFARSLAGAPGGVAGAGSRRLLELRAFARGEQESEARRLSLARAETVRRELVAAGLEERNIRLRPLGAASAGTAREAVEILLQP